MALISPNSFFTFQGRYSFKNGAVKNIERAIPFTSVYGLEKQDDGNCFIVLMGKNSEGIAPIYKISETSYKEIKEMLKQVEWDSALKIRDIVKEELTKQKVGTSISQLGLKD